MTDERASDVSGRASAETAAPQWREVVASVDRMLRIDLPVPVHHSVEPEAVVETILREGIIGTACPRFADHHGQPISRHMEGRPIEELDGFWMKTAPELLRRLADCRFQQSQFDVSGDEGASDEPKYRVWVVTETDHHGLHSLWCLERDLPYEASRSSENGIEDERTLAIVRAARLTALDELTSSLSHELNQPLGAITNWANGCVRRLEQIAFEDSTLLDALQSIVSQTKRAAGIIKRMQVFARRGSEKREPRSLAEVLGDTIEITRSQAQRAQVTVEARFDADPDIVVVDSGQIGQATIHLLRNAIDALELLSDGRPRTIRVETRTIHGQGGRTMVETSIIDSGDGVSETERQRLFAPFYSTRPSGLGLGLSASRAIVESHGGKLRLVPSAASSVPETCFQFTLPLRSAQPSS